MKKSMEMCIISHSSFPNNQEYQERPLCFVMSYQHPIDFILFMKSEYEMQQQEIIANSTQRNMAAVYT